MKIKLSKAEMQALEQLLSTLIDVIKPEETVDKLLHAIFLKLYQKTAKALVVLQKEYSFKMDDITALAFCLEFSQWALTPADFTDNLVLKLTNQIQQHYA